MKIYYIINARIPTEKAHGIQVMKMCEAFAREGEGVTLIVPRRRNTIKEDPFAYYGVERNFRIIYLPTLDFFGFHIPFSFFIETFTFAVSVWLFLLKEKEMAILYTRGETPVLFSLFLPKRFKLFWETHIKPQKMWWYRNVLAKSRGIIVVTKYYRNELAAKYGIPPGNILCAPDGVDLEIFDITINREEARKKLGLPLDKKLAVYTGHLYSWKGADTLALAARLLLDDTMVVFVGGTEEDIVPFRQKYGDNPHILIVGQRPHKEIPFYLKAADVLVLPNTAKEASSRWYTSPIKLFEYMASERPIIASDLPSIRDVLNERNVIFVPPDDPKSIAGAVETLLKDNTRVDMLAKNARKDVEVYTWALRAKNILSFIDKQIQS